MAKIGVIGGTGLNKWDAADGQNILAIDTAYGKPSAPFIVKEIAGREVIFLARHGVAHHLPPHQVNYRANIAALKQLGVEKIIAVNAVGGISAKLATPSICIPDQLIDYTWGREHSFSALSEQQLAEGVTNFDVQHIDFGAPFDERLRKILIESAGQVSVNVAPTGCYGCTQGPRLETIAEIKRLERDGCDVVGMTAMPEAALAAEKGIAYASICLVVNPAAGKAPGVITMDEIRQALEVGMVDVKKILVSAINRL